MSFVYNDKELRDALFQATDDLQALGHRLGQESNTPQAAIPASFTAGYCYNTAVQTYNQLVGRVNLLIALEGAELSEEMIAATLSRLKASSLSRIRALLDETRALLDEVDACPPDPAVDMPGGIDDTQADSASPADGQQP